MDDFKLDLNDLKLFPPLETPRGTKGKCPNQAPAQETPSFPQYARLPRELRDEIWAHLFESAYGEVPWSLVQRKNNGQVSWATYVFRTDRLNSQQETLRCLLDSCDDARRYAAHLQRRQMALFPVLRKPDGSPTPRFARHSKLINLEYSPFDASMLLDDRMEFPKELPILARRVRHVAFRPLSFFMRLGMLWRRRKARCKKASGIDFRRLMLGHFASPESRVQTVTVLSEAQWPVDKPLDDIVNFGMNVDVFEREREGASEDSEFDDQDPDDQAPNDQAPNDSDNEKWSIPTRVELALIHAYWVGPDSCGQPSPDNGEPVWTFEDNETWKSQVLQFCKEVQWVIYKNIK